jgi:DNA-directed RNA polymerase subunit RPC12/RpoP
MTDFKTLPAVATSVPYLCKKCNGEKYHRVLVHKTPTTAQIECEQCHSKKTIGLARAKKPVMARKARAPVNEAPALWVAKNQKLGTDKIQDYQMRGSFSVDQALKHSTFGIGFVIKSEPKKIEVVFPEFVKVLVQNQQ